MAVAFAFAAIINRIFQQAVVYPFRETNPHSLRATGCQSRIQCTASSLSGYNSRYVTILRADVKLTIVKRKLHRVWIALSRRVFDCFVLLAAYSRIVFPRWFVYNRQIDNLPSKFVYWFLNNRTAYLEKYLGRVWTRLFSAIILIFSMIR